MMRGGVAIGLSHEAGLRLAIRCARDSMPPMRLAIIDDLAAFPYSTATDVRRRFDKPRATVDRQMQALHTLGVLTLDEVQYEQRTTWYYTLAELMARLGHSTPAAAMRYQHAAAGRDQVIAEALSELARGERPAP